jgi:gamma-glutamylcysteine synthetase
MYTTENKTISLSSIAPYAAIAVAAFGIWKYLEGTTVLSANDSQSIKYNTVSIADHERRVRETEKAIRGIETSLISIDKTQTRILNKLDHVAEPLE